MAETGFGSASAALTVYIENRPPMAEYQWLTGIQPLAGGDIENINRHCGNGWRKVFNVYAKLLFELDPTQFSFSEQAANWQQFRDQHLLQAKSDTALLFSPPRLTPQHDRIHIIAGRTYANTCLQQGLQAQLVWLDKEFAVDHRSRLLICPYFDYRQLTNEKIVRLAKLIAGLSSSATATYL